MSSRRCRRLPRAAALPCCRALFSFHAARAAPRAPARLLPACPIPCRAASAPFPAPLLPRRYYLLAAACGALLLPCRPPALPYTSTACHHPAGSRKHGDGDAARRRCARAYAAAWAAAAVPMRSRAALASRAPGARAGVPRACGQRCPACLRPPALPAFYPPTILALRIPFRGFFAVLDGFCHKRHKPLLSSHARRVIARARAGWRQAPRVRFATFAVHHVAVLFSWSSFSCRASCRRARSSTCCPAAAEASAPAPPSCFRAGRLPAARAALRGAATCAPRTGAQNFLFLYPIYTYYLLPTAYAFQ